MFKKILCKHKNNEVVCWHWVHANGMDIRHLEIQFRCKDCGKYFFRHIKDHNECEKFIESHKDKEWSDTCKPVFERKGVSRNL